MLIISYNQQQIIKQQQRSQLMITRALNSIIGQKYSLYQMSKLFKKQAPVTAPKKKQQVVSGTSSSTSTKKKTIIQTKFKAVNLKSIDQTNKFFQGIRMNTKYAKFYNEDKIDNIAKYTGVRKINDLPFQTEKIDNREVLQRGSGKGVAYDILAKIPKQQLTKHLETMSTDYFTDLIQNKRTVKIEPNFQREARRVINGLTKAGYNFKLTKNQKSNVTIKNVQLFKGIQVNRNNNYSVDSYQILREPDYTFYKLWQKGAYKIPEQQWNTQGSLLLRVTAKVSAPFSIQISKKDQPTKTVNHPHIFVFELDLKRPPKFAQFSMNQKQYLKCYVPKVENFTITNVDQRNPFAAFTFEENQKKDMLINKLA